MGKEALTKVVVLLLALYGCSFIPLWGIEGASGTFTLHKEHDSLYHLVLTTDSTCDRWTLPYPVYRMETGDVDGNGSTDALVGVVKGTRFHPEKGRRLFIFKNYRGLVRPLWLGSKLGGRLIDFRFANRRVRSLEAASDSIFAVAEYEWDGFGLSFCRYLAKHTDEATARMAFDAETGMEHDIRTQETSAE